MRSLMLLAILTATSLSAAVPNDVVATRAVAGDANAIAQLRAQGQRGVDRLVALHARTKLDEKAYRNAIDRVCRQRDCAWSQLYWYTDLNTATAAARAQHRPILSLRLLGNLDDDMSCANSRFFRTILYSNREIADYLRANFILHWSSERPVPKVTIDFGDGRVLHRTLTGNSVHYLLDQNGAPLDALPGLYAPIAFLANVRDMRNLFDDVQTWVPAERAGHLQLYHMGRVRYATRGGDRVSRLLSPATAWDAAPRAGVKGMAEIPILTRVSFGTSAARFIERVGAVTKDESDLTKLDDNSLDLITTKHGGRGSGIDLDAAMASMRRMLAADTLRNEYELRAQIHRWFLETTSPSFRDLNTFVYDTVFLTPRGDEWLGLVPADTFTAIESEGLVVADTMRR
ncbi:MAG: hypothetical protein QOI24_3395 [Acidobacteriota bacterium]|jgi:hypothetical protein|nr:hypothetical protein [Acidobacteriota bacterium]